MTNSEMLSGEWINVAEDFKICSEGTLEKNKGTNEASALELFLTQNATAIPKSAVSDKNQKIIDSESLDNNVWEDLVEDFEILYKDAFEVNHDRKEIIFGNMTDDELIPPDNVGDISVSDTPDEEIKSRGGSPLEIIVSERNGDVIPKLISVLSGEEPEKTVLVDLCRRIRGNTKWLTEYNKNRSQKLKITLTELTDKKRGKVNKNGSAFLFGIMATNILCFALGLGIGLWNRDYVPTYAIFEFDLDSVVY